MLREEVDLDAEINSESMELYQYNFSTIQPLLSIPLLAVVRLELGLPIQLTDEDLTRVGQAWHDIEVLQICPDPFSERARDMRPMCSIHGLMSIVEQCRRLRQLGVYMDFSFLVDDLLIANARVTSMEVEQLDVGRSWIADAPRVASLLSGVLPELKKLVWSGMNAPSPALWRTLPPAFEYSGEWRQVFDLLPVFRATRLNERTARNINT